MVFFNRAPADYLKRDLVSHTRRVCSLYKRLLRDVDFWHEDIFERRWNKLLIRKEFDQNKNLKDMREAKVLLEKGEKRYLDTVNPYNIRGQPIHPFSKEGISHDRNMLSPDFVMDFWHPLEKAQYPYFFAKREQLKDEYIAIWKKKMMKPGQDEKPDRS